MQFTDITVWLGIAMTLAVFQISKVDDETEKASAFAGCVSVITGPVIKPNMQSCVCQSSAEVQVQDQATLSKGGRNHLTIFVDGCMY
jgi:hypothetical protein